MVSDRLEVALRVCATESDLTRSTAEGGLTIDTEIKSC